MKNISFVSKLALVIARCELVHRLLFLKYFWFKKNHAVDSFVINKIVLCISTELIYNHKIAYFEDHKWILSLQMKKKSIFLML